MSSPYVFVNDRPQNYNYLRDHLLAIPVALRPKFDQLNPYLRNNVVMPGEVVVVSDGPSYMCTPEETQLMQLAQGVRMALIGTTNSEAEVMVQNFNVLQSILSYGSIGIGASTGAWTKHLTGLEDLLKDIETLHQRWRSGALTNDQFFAQRRSLFARMETQLKGIGRVGTDLNNRGKMKRILGISSKSYIHTGEIAGYARHVRVVSKMASSMSKGTYVGIALDVGAGALEIQEACAIGREEQCTKAKYVESGKTTGGIALSWLGGTVGATAGPAVCVGLGIPSGGVVTAACALVGGALLAWGGGKLGSMGGEASTTFLYETVYER